MGDRSNESTESFEGGAEFEFDLATPLFEQIRDLLDRVKDVPLDRPFIERIAERPGVYILLSRGEPVYVGKADRSVRTRLAKHRFMLSGRKNLQSGDMTFKSVCFARTWDPFKPESHLIDHYGTNGPNGWNGKGFGANEPGINRRQTQLGETHFFRRFPINAEWACEEIEAGDYDAFQLLRKIKKSVPFWFSFPANRRVQGGGKANREAERIQSLYRSTKIRVPSAGLPVSDLLSLIARSLSGDWRVIATPSHLYLEPDASKSYPEMEVIWPARSSRGREKQ